MAVRRRSDGIGVSGSPFAVAAVTGIERRKGKAMFETQVTVVGNIVNDPKRRRVGRPGSDEVPGGQQFTTTRRRRHVGGRQFAVRHRQLLGPTGRRCGRITGQGVAGDRRGPRSHQRIRGPRRHPSFDVGDARHLGRPRPVSLPSRAIEKTVCAGTDAAASPTPDADRAATAGADDAKRRQMQRPRPMTEAGCRCRPEALRCGGCPSGDDARGVAAREQAGPSA